MAAFVQGVSALTCFDLLGENSCINSCCFLMSNQQNSLCRIKNKKDKLVKINTFNLELAINDVWLNGAE